MRWDIVNKTIPVNNPTTSNIAMLWVSVHPSLPIIFTWVVNLLTNYIACLFWHCFKFTKFRTELEIIISKLLLMNFITKSGSLSEIVLTSN